MLAVEEKKMGRNDSLLGQKEAAFLLSLPTTT